MNYSQLIKQKAEKFGFQSCGISKAEFLGEEAPRLEDWLKNNYHGEMKYMENHFDKRLNPTLLVDGAKSVISLSYNYFPKEKIERLENLISNFGDTNDYNGSPILAATGEIKGFSAKGESGKVVELKEGAELKYVSWDQAPESTKLEIEKLEDFIYTCTQTPNISFEQMKGLGAVSGVAFERIMIDAHLKAKDMQNGIYGEGIQRRCNFLINAISILYTECKGAGNLDVTPQFELFKIDDRVERVETLLKANGGKALMSHKESIAANGTTDDVEKTYQEIKAEITPVNQN